MSNLSDFFATTAGGSPLPYQQFVLGQSKTWTVPTTGKIKVVLTGGGGQGAFVPNKQITISSNYGSGTGGGGGGYSEKVIDVTAGETFTVTIGAGGFNSIAVNSLSALTNGTSGGNSSFVTASAAESVNMIANGGGGGQAQAQTNADHIVAGGLGGTASGGTANYTGGAGGIITRDSGANYNQYNAYVTGGGSVSIYGTAYHGGNIDHGAGNYHRMLSTGGAGVGGHGGFADSTGTGTKVLFSSGGSATKDGATYETTSTGSMTGSNAAGGPTNTPTISILDAQGYGGLGRHHYNSSVAGIAGTYGGGGGAGSYYNGNNSTGQYFFGGNGGGFGGGGACIAVSSQNYSGTGAVRAGVGGNGGGGSGAFSGPFHTMTSASNRSWAGGGDGVCIVMYV